MQSLKLLFATTLVGCALLGCVPHAVVDADAPTTPDILNSAERLLSKRSGSGAVSSRHGVWLVGASTVLVRPNGQRLSAETGLKETVATALNDGSVLVFGKTGAAGGVRQLMFDETAGRIEVREISLRSADGKPDRIGQSYRQQGYGIALTTLKDGRVLVLGGSRTPNLVSIVTPRSDAASWTIVSVAPLPHPRVGAAVATLPDGRVVVTGAPHLNCYFAAADVRGADIYDPATDRWSTLPPLPFTPCSDAYGAREPSIAVTPNGSLVVGGHLEPHVMVLRRDTASANGFASSWLVYGQFDNPRIGGVVHALSNDEVVVAGGVDNRSRDFGGCCHPTPGYDRVSIAGAVRKASRALRYIGVGAAQRGASVFAAGGRRFGFTGFGQMRYSAYVEAIDLGSGKVRQLPNLPFVSGAVQVRWVDEDRVVAKGSEAGVGRNSAFGEELSSYVPESSGALAVFSFKDNRWGEPIVLPSIAQSTLLDVIGNEAWLLSPDGTLQRLNLDTRQVANVMHSMHRRMGGFSRLLATNRLVLAGGSAQSDLISVLDEACEATPEAKCPERYVGLGPFVPAPNFEIVAFGADAVEPDVQSKNAAMEAKTSAAAIGRDGHVYMLVSDAQDDAQRLVQSIEGSLRWRAMPPPAGGRLCKNDCRLAIVPDPRDAGRDLLFLRQGAIDAAYVDDAVAQQTANVWLWIEPERRWQKVLTTDGMSARAVPHALDGVDGGAGGGRMMSLGWHLDSPILWTTRQ